MGIAQAVSSSITEIKQTPNEYNQIALLPEHQVALTSQNNQVQNQQQQQQQKQQQQQQQQLPNPYTLLSNSFNNTNPTPSNQLVPVQNQLVPVQNQLVPVQNQLGAVQPSQSQIIATTVSDLSKRQATQPSNSFQGSNQQGVSNQLSQGLTKTTSDLANGYVPFSAQGQNQGQGQGQNQNAIGQQQQQSRDNNFIN